MLACSYEVLIHALLKTWSPSGPKLAAPELVAFIQNSLDNLPSTSSEPEGQSTSTILLGDLLVDLIWAVDAQLSEFIPDAKLPASAAKNIAKPGQSVKGNAEASDNKPEPTQEQLRAERLKANAESDRVTLADFTKRLLVRLVHETSSVSPLLKQFIEQESC